MRLFISFLLSPFLFMLAGCLSSSTVGHWSKPNTSEIRVKSDRIECETQSKPTANSDILEPSPINQTDADWQIENQLFEVQQQVDLVAECMRAKGYRNR